MKHLKELEAENVRLPPTVAELTLDEVILTEAAKGNFCRARRRACIEHVRAELGILERRACSMVAAP